MSESNYTNTDAFEWPDDVNVPGGYDGTYVVPEQIPRGSGAVGHVVVHGLAELNQ